MQLFGCHTAENDDDGGGGAAAERRGSAITLTGLALRDF